MIEKDIKKNLDKLFNAKSIAVIGASRKPNTVGNGILKSLLKGGVFESRYNKAFLGKIYPINPKAEKILGLKCYKRVTEIKEPIDAAVISVNARLVPLVMQDCAKKGIKAIIIISAGFSEFGKEGTKLKDQFMKIAKENKISIIGPNCLGVIRPSKFNASFAPCMPPDGPVGFISQSGALADSIIDWAVQNRYGMSAMISYGNKADLDAHDYMYWLNKDKKTKAIAMYIEGLKDGKKFMNIAKEVTKNKPVIALKGGRTQAGQKAISSHTGSLAGSYDTYMTAFKQTGVIPADTVEELFDLAKVLATQPSCKKNSIAIVTNGGGAGVLCADYCHEMGIKLTPLKRSTLEKMDKSKVMHPAYSRRNPLDIIGDALPIRYEVAINEILKQDDIHGLIMLQTIQTMTDPIKDGEIVAKARKKFPDKPIVCTYMGGKFTSPGMKYLDKHGIPDYNDPKKAAKAMWALIEKGKITK